MKKLFWIVAIALCAMGLEWELATFFTKFLAWTANTAVTIQTARSLPFPAITVCNNNPVTSDWLAKLNPTNITNAPAPVTNIQQSGGTSGTQQSGTQGTQQQQSGPAPSPSQSASPPAAPPASPSPSGSSSGSGTTPGSPSPTPSPIAGGSSSSSAPSGGSGSSPAPPSSGSAPSGGGGPSPAPPGPGKRRKRQAIQQQPQQQGPQQGPQQQQQNPSRQNFNPGLQAFLEIQAKACLVAYENRSEAGHQLCDMVLAAEYQGVALDIASAFDTWHWNPFYGNCFTFNAGYTKGETTASSTETNAWTIKVGSDNTGVRTSTQSGDIYGLYLLLNADTHHYMDSTTQVGWRIIIHNQTVMPFPEESGVFVAPGTSTRIGVSMNYIERLGTVSNYIYDAKYSDCIEETDLITDDPRNAYSKMMEVSYSKSGCLKTCYQQNVMKKCKCFDFDYPNRGSAFAGYTEYPPCAYDNTTLWECKLGVAKKFHEDDLTCDCPDTCTAYSFEASLSNLKWPTSSSTALVSVCEDIYDIMLARANGSDATCHGMSYLQTQAAKGSAEKVPDVQEMKRCVNGQYDSQVSSDDEMANYIVGNKYAEVYVFYKDFNYQTVVETQYLEFTDLLAYLGGILGLFFGFTFLTLFEYIQFILDLMILGLGRLFCGSGNKTGDISAAEFSEEHLQGPITRRRSMHLKNQLRPGTVVPNGNILMPPPRNHPGPPQMVSPNADAASYGFPFLKYVNDGHPLSKKY